MEGQLPRQRSAQGARLEWFKAPSRKVRAMGSIWRCLKQVRWLAGPAAVLAGLTAHGLLALVVLAALVVVLAVLARGTLLRVLSSEDLTDRGTKIIQAWRGGRRIPDTRPRRGRSTGRE